MNLNKLKTMFKYTLVIAIFVIATCALAQLLLYKEAKAGIDSSTGWRAEVTDLTTENIEDDNVYIICDVRATTSNNEGTTDLACVMPDGSLHIYIVDDAPEGRISIVTFKVVRESQENYSSYEVVALR